MASILEKAGWCARDWHRACQLVYLFALCSVMSTALAAPAGQKNYASPEAAIAGLVEAVKSGNQPKLGAILGAHGNMLISSGDAVADAQGRASFIKAYGEANRLVFEGDAKAVLVIGKDNWPFPIPLVKSAGAWKFDTQQGEQEILSRRIGRNELAAMQVCLAIVDAEHDYAASHLDKDGVPEYAARIVSTTGKQDGLYWPSKPDEPQSPLGPLIAAAASEGYPPALSPYHGYYYRILTAQGKDAPGGEYAYFIHGKMIGGFAVIAYPARYGASGIKTFIVDHEGAVFQKDLGLDTGALAPKTAQYNPDPSWQPVSRP